MVLSDKEIFLFRSRVNKGLSDMRQTKLKRAVTGFSRNLGHLPSGSQPKFYLGHDQKEAQIRLERIQELWKAVEKTHGTRPGKPVWDDATLQAAKAIASGNGARLPKGQNEQPEKYFTRINALKRAGVAVEPSDLEMYELGKADLVSEVAATKAELTKAMGTKSAVGQSLHQAVQAYCDWIKVEYSESDGKMSDTAKTKCDQMKTLMTYVADRDLGELDFQACDDIFGIFRRRPLSKRYGRPMTRRKSCTNYMGEMDRFFKWLHKANDWDWRKPEDYQDISHRPREFDEDVERESDEIPTWTVQELRILNEYATPLERVFLLLGLNCSYGADQSGRLRVKHVHIKGDGTSFIRRIRRKRKVISMHLLWEQTKQGLQWAISRNKIEPDDFAIVNSKGSPYWYKTKGGNRCQQIPNLMKRLIERVRKDHPDFRSLPFNSLRDTSANFVRRIAGAEIASIHLAHKHQSGDENLGRYTNPTRKKHFKALKKLESKLAEVFQAAGSEPFGKVRKTYVGKLTKQRIFELREAGTKVKDIAKKFGIAEGTVYRYLAEAKVQAGA